MPAIIRVVDGRTIIKMGENTALASKYADQAEAAALSVAALTPTINDLARYNLPDITADKIVEAAATALPSVYQNVSFTSGDLCVVRAIAKKGERSRLNIYTQSALAISFSCIFDIDKVIASGTGAVIEDLGNGWCLCTVTATAIGTGNSNVQFRIASDVGLIAYAGNGSSGLFLDYASVELDGVEQIADNKISGAGWSTSNSSITTVSVEQDTATATLAAVAKKVNGVLGAKLVGDVGTGTKSLYRSIPWQNGVDYQIECDFQKGEVDQLNLFCNGGATFDATFDASLGTATGTGASIVDLGNGKFRAIINVTASSTLSRNLQLRPYINGTNTWEGDGDKGIYFFGTRVLVDGYNILDNGADYSSTAWTKLAVSVAADDRAFTGYDAWFRNLEEQISETSGTPLAGSNWLAFGSSITAQNKYTTPLASLTGMTLTNKGVSGGSLGEASNGHYGSRAILDEIEDASSDALIADADIVTIEAGTNDLGAASVPIGSPGDATAATFYGAMWAARAHIAAKNPAAKVVFITAFGADSRLPAYSATVANSAGHYLHEYQEAMRIGAGIMGSPCIDVGQSAGLGYFTNNDLTSDGLHPNDAGGLRIARFINAKLKEIYQAGFFLSDA